MRVTQWIAVLSLSLAMGRARAAEPPAAALKVEQERLGNVVLDHFLAATERVMRVGDPIRIAGAPYCGRQVGAALGVFTANRDTFAKLFESDFEFEKIVQRVAVARFSLDQRERVLVVVPGLPADKAGVKPGDVLTRVAGHALGRRDHLYALRVESLDAPLEVIVERDGRDVALPVEVRLGCAYPVRAWFGNEINAFAGHLSDATGTYVLGGMLDFLPSDDDLAVVLGHELGHLILYSGGTRRTEADADYVGLYVAARAGFEIQRAPAIWDRLGRANPYTTIAWGFYSHPSSSERATALAAAIAEITAKRDTGAPLDPVVPGETTVTAPSDPTAASEHSAKLRAGALEELSEKRERLLRVSHALRTRGAELCGEKVVPVLGAAVARRRDVLFGREKEAEEIFGLVDEVKVLAVLPDSPAAAGGVTVGDLVVAVNGNKISRTEDVFDALRATPEIAPKLELERAGVRVEATLPRVMGCPQEFELVMSGSFDPFAERNGKDILVPEGLFRFARDDDEFAFVLAHQVAHHQLGTSLLTDFSGEADADMLGLRIAKRAGFDVSKVPALLDRMVGENPPKLDEKRDEYRRHLPGHSTLHGNMARRALAVRAELNAESTR